MEEVWFETFDQFVSRLGFERWFGENKDRYGAGMDLKTVRGVQVFLTTAQQEIVLVVSSAIPKVDMAYSKFSAYSVLLGLFLVVNLARSNRIEMGWLV